ncbi:CLUMA_CG019931, isoform A [Clunio marinus]|uniref:CLUMA_CG019931, isoform A n=1 Tax=Clunio marinus TaxID=568069 RepID=A0A1J1J267_9DIPT|nr:CLUMA_CG019931, isoform A [Clunio marinus]
MENKCCGKKFSQLKQKLQQQQSIKANSLSKTYSEKGLMIPLQIEVVVEIVQIGPPCIVV